MQIFCTKFKYCIWGNKSKFIQSCYTRIWSGLP